MRALDPEVVEHADAVGGHLGQRVGGGALVAAQDLAEGGHRGGGQDRRAPDVAVVVADDVEAAAREVGAEVLVPAEHLRAQAHDEQHGGIGGVAERLEADLDVAADAAEALGHAEVNLAGAPRRASRSASARGRSRAAAQRSQPRRGAPGTMSFCAWRSGVMRMTFHTRPSFSIAADEPRRRIELARPEAVDGRAREGVVVVVPGLAERRQRQPEDVGRVVLDVEAPAPEEVADGVDRPRDVVDEEDADQAAPQQAGEGAGEPAGDQVAGQRGERRARGRRATGTPG